MRLKRLLPWVASSILISLPISQATASEVDAAGTYKMRCSSCHGLNGEGTADKAPSLGPPLRGNPLVINAPATLLMGIIRNGRGGQQRVYDESYPNMPAFDAGMVPDPIGLATYLKTVLQQQKTASHSSTPTFQDSFGTAAAPRTSARTAAAEPVYDGHESLEAARHLAAADEAQSQLQLLDPAHHHSTK